MYLVTKKMATSAPAGGAAAENQKQQAEKQTENFNQLLMHTILHYDGMKEMGRTINT
jgi:hypothetical protein